MGDWSGTLWTPAALQKPTATQLTTIRDAVAALTDAPGSYTPTIRFGTTAWTIGNGVISARYLRSGKKVEAYGRVTIGSTTNFNAGTGTFTVSLPVNAASASVGVMIGQCRLEDVSAPAVNMQFVGTSAVDRVAPFSASGAASQHNIPWTWASGDSFDWALVYEGA